MPIAWRSSTSIQIGETVIVERVTRSHVAWLTSLDGLSTPAAILESLTIPESEAGRLIRALLAACALDDAATIPDALRWTPQPTRDVAAARHGAAVHTYRDPDIAGRVTQAREDSRVHIVGRGPIADEVRGAMDAAGVGEDEEGLVILTEGPHPDVPLSLGQQALDRPHLPVGVYGAQAVVGPLVVPGVTSCLRCAHLHRRDADPAWPVVAVQWAQAITALAVPPRDPLLTRLAAAHAALLARAWIDTPEQRDTWAEHALRIVLPAGQAHRETRPPHPLCGCLWPPT